MKLIDLQAIYLKEVKELASKEQHEQLEEMENVN